MAQTNLRYTVELNCKDAYTLMNKTKPEWRAIYEVIGYEGIYTELYGYRNTALKDCDRMLDYLYNKKDESF